MKGSVKFLLIGAMALMLGACGGGEKQTVLDTNRVYKVGTTAEYPPFETLENGKIVGYDVDVIDAVAKKIGIKYEWKDMNFDGLISALQFKKIDIVIAGISSSPEREKVVNFSIPYHESKTAYIMNKNNPMTMEELKGKTFGVDLGTSYETTARSIEGAKVIAFSSTGGTLLALKSQKVDCIMVGEVVANEYIEKNPELAIFGYGDGEACSIAFNKDDIALQQSFNKALAELKDMNFDGLISALQFKKIDIVIAGISSSPEREKVVNFSIPYHESKTAYIMNKNNPMTMEELKGKTFGVDLGTSYETTARSIEGAKVIAFSSTGGTLLALKSQKVDCIMVGEVVANEYIEKNPELAIFGYGDGEACSIAFNKDDIALQQSFNKALAELKEDGTLKKLQDKYGI